MNKMINPQLKSNHPDFVRFPGTSNQICFRTQPPLLERRRRGIIGAHITFCNSIKELEKEISPPGFCDAGARGRGG